MAHSGDHEPNPQSVADPTSEIHRATGAHRGALRAGFLYALGALAAYGLVLALVHVQGTLLALVVSLFTALGLQPLIDWAVRRGLPRPIAAAAVMFILLAGVVLIAVAVVPVGAQQVGAIARNAPGWINGLRDYPPIAHLNSQFGFLEKIGELMGSGSWITGLGGALGAGLAAANLVFSLVITVVLTLYLIWAAPSVKEAIYQLAPASTRPRFRYLASEVFQRIGDYLSGMLVDVSLWGVGAYLALRLFGLGPYAIALALMVALLTAIPMLGAVVALMVCTLTALSVSPGAALGVLIYFLAYMQVDAFVVQPRIFSRSLKVPPVLVIVGAVGGMALLGIAGAILAIPTVASLLLIYREVIVPRLDQS